MEKLDLAALNEGLKMLPHWRYDSGRDAISREFRFADFAQTFAFMTELALHSEREQHHPEWSNVYNRLTIHLTTHDASGVSSRDIAWAVVADRVYARHCGAEGHHDERCH